MSMRIGSLPGIPMALVFLCACVGCTASPEYTRPTVEVPREYRFANGVAPVATLPAVPAWWHGFGDPELDALVSEGLVANHDLRIATARVDEFAARVVATHAQGLPQHLDVGEQVAGRIGLGSTQRREIGRAHV